MALELSEKDIDNRMSPMQRHLCLGLIVCTIFVGSMCFSLQCPIYPKEAELKGLQPTQYGFVFGVFQLIIFLTAPVFGKYINVIGSTALFKVGVFTSAWCTILFGFLDASPPGNTFLALSVAIRVAAAFGESAIYISSYVIAIRSYPKAMATAMASVETSFGVGSILGPTLGAALYELGGFRLPFLVIGALLMLFFFISFCFINEIHDVRSEGGPKVLEAFRIPAVSIMSYAIILVAISVGFIAAFLEPHLSSFGISTLYVGLIFMALGGTYAFAAIMWGKITDRIGKYRLLNLFGLLFYIVGFLLLGPLPFVPLEKSITLIVVALVLCGNGMGCLLVCSAMGIMDDIITRGSPKNMATQGFVSGLYNALFAAGAFIGPTVGGPLYDSIGFDYATLIIWILFVLALFLFVIHEIALRLRDPRSIAPTQKTPLIRSISKSTSESLPQLAWMYASGSVSGPKNPI